MSNEHLLRRKLREVVQWTTSPGRERVTLEKTNAGEWSRRTETLRTGAFDLKVRQVCVQCNNGWMEDLEEAAALILEPMLRGEPVTGSPALLTTLATWATKTAYVRAAMDARPCRIPKGWRQEIKTHRRPPNGTQVWVAYCKPLVDPLTSHMAFSYSWEDVAAVTDDLQPTGLRVLDVRPREAHGYFVTVAVNYVSFFVQGAGSPALDELLTQRFAFSRAYNGALTRIWPEPETLQWPPRQQIPQSAVYHLSDSVGRRLSQLSAMNSEP